MRRSTWSIVLGAALLLTSIAGGAAYLTLRGDGGGDAGLAALLDTTSAAESRARTDEIIAFWQARVEGDPIDFISSTKLGSAYIRQARETGDVSAYERAEAALRRALELRPDHTPASAELATVLYAKHDFAGALWLAQLVYAADPSATQALATVGDAQVELGNYDAAQAAYDELPAVASGAAVLSRRAHLAELRGDLDTALSLLEQANEQAETSTQSGERPAWYRLQLGELAFNTGRYDAAERRYREALERFPGYHPAVAGLAKVAAARGEDDAAIDLYERAIAAVPQPAYLAALGDLYAHAGDEATARQRYDTVELIGTLAAINRAVYNRELALFYADHGVKTAEAVALALSELEVRKDVYGYDAAAWALYQDGRAQEASPLMEQALRLGTQDAMLLFHAGMIARELGDDDAARSHLERALELNPRFSIRHADTAADTLRDLRAAVQR